jgi:predicted DNA-binding transcriptional regulator AlpA
VVALAVAPGGGQRPTFVLGVSRQRVHQIETSDPSFPKPVAELSAGKVWESADVERWIAERRQERASGSS